MSHQLIGRNPDLKRLRDEGFNVSIEGAYLVLRDICYVNSAREIQSGILVSDLTLAGDHTDPPQSHIIYFAGEHPCHRDGTPIQQISHSSDQRLLVPGLTVHFSFSNKPKDAPTPPFPDYYQKMTHYVSIICGPATSLDPRASPKTFQFQPEVDPDSPFEYLDSASSRADIVIATRKLAIKKVAIVGLGGTGSYVLDFVAKTPVGEIHLFDDDPFLQHNAFRAPGAATREELNARKTKVDYFATRYSAMHKGIRDHAVRIGPSNTALLSDMDFVFICVDRGEAKRTIIEALEALDTPFVDVGMGLTLVDEKLLGVLRITAQSSASRAVSTSGRVSFTDAVEDDYARNIQVADLNALNAVMAVIRWKKLFGFYHDQEREHHSTYTLDTGMLLHGDFA